MSTNEAAADAQAVDSTPDAPAQAEPARENSGAEEQQEMTIEEEHPRSRGENAGFCWFSAGA